MNEDLTTQEEPQLTREELSRLARDGGPPLTRRERRLRERAVASGALIETDGGLVVAETTAAPEPASGPWDNGELEPPVVTSADVLAGKVPAATGLTRRQLREIAAQHEAQTIDTGDLESTVESDVVGDEPPEPEAEAPQEPVTPVTPTRVSTRVVASELQEKPEPPRSEPARQQTARRPVVHPQGATTGEYTGEFDQIRQAMADINAAPATPDELVPPQRRSVFEANVPAELAQPALEEAPEQETTAATDLTAVIDAPVVTDDLLPDFEPVAEPVEAAPFTPVETPTTPTPGDPDSGFPDWHTLTNLPAVPGDAPVEQRVPREIADGEERRGRTPLWLVVFQWIVISAVAVVLGLLVWYAITKGFGSGGADAIGVATPYFDLLT